MSDDDRTTTATQESSEAPGNPGSDEPKAGYGTDVPSDAGTGGRKPEERPAGGDQSAR
jgi:hypothetical protein